MLKFNRTYTLKVYRKVTGTHTATDSLLISVSYPLTMEFSINRRDLTSAGDATFRILNLNEEARNLIRKQMEEGVYFPVELYAGYESFAPLIFKGSISEAKSYRVEGSTNFVTEILAFDGGFAYAYAYSNFSLPALASKAQALRLLAADLEKNHVGFGKISDAFLSTLNPMNIYQTPRTFNGPTRQLIWDETGGKFFVDNQKIYMLTDEDTLEGEIPLVSSATGLLGSPMRYETYLVADMLFEPRVKVGQVVDLESIDQPRYNGLNKVIGLTHSGVISGSVGGKCKTQVHMWLAGAPVMEASV